MPLSRTTIERINNVIGPEYERDVKDLLKARRSWKRTRDIIEVSSKIVGGLGSVVAFAASSVHHPVATDWMSFGAGCIGTISLSLMLFASYSGYLSRQRTRELNNILKVAGVTQVPQLVDQITNVGDIEAPFDRSLLNQIEPKQ